MPLPYFSASSYMGVNAKSPHLTICDWGASQPGLRLSVYMKHRQAPPWHEISGAHSGPCSYMAILATLSQRDGPPVGLISSTHISYQLCWAFPDRSLHLLGVSYTFPRFDFELG